jgi:hypothetical protein
MHVAGREVARGSARISGIIMRDAHSITPPTYLLWRRAWAFSLVFHLTATALLGISVHRAHRGAAQSATMTIGLVLDRTPEESASEAGEPINASISVAPTPQEPLPVSLPVEAPRPEIRVEVPRVEPAPTQEAETPRPQPEPASKAGGASASRSGRSGTSRGGRFGMFGASATQVSVFGVKGTGTKFVYLFDRSTSMEGRPLAAAKRELVASLESLDSIHQFQIIFFDTEPRPLDVTGRGRLAYADEQNKRRAASLVGGVTSDLGTDRYAALKRALAYRPDVIFFLTDADGPMGPSEIEEIERASARSGTTICVIEFGLSPRQPAENFLKQLARQSGGQYGYVDAGSLSQ